MNTLKKMLLKRMVKKRIAKFQTNVKKSYQDVSKNMSRKISSISPLK